MEGVKMPSNTGITSTAIRRQNADIANRKGTGRKTATIHTGAVLLEIAKPRRNIRIKSTINRSA